MLDHRVLAHDLYVVHLQQSLSHFVPGGHARYVVKHRRTFAKRDSLLNLLDKSYAPEVHVVWGFFHGTFVMDGVRVVPFRVVAELRGAEQEGEVLVVVETPHTVRARWL